MRRTLVRAWAFVGLFVAGMMIVATFAEARPSARGKRGQQLQDAQGQGGRWSSAAALPSSRMGYTGTCGFGHYYLGEEVSFSHAVQFSVQVDSTHGYLVDCLAGADAYLEFRALSGGIYTYAVWGQLGSYQ